MNLEKKKLYTFAATCTRETEALVAEEILSFGGENVQEGRGVVTWTGSLESAYRGCLWSRFSSRILLQIISVEISGEDSLYERVQAIDWSEHLDVDSTLAVDCTASKDAPVTHSGYAALRVKDTVVDQFRETFGSRPSVDTEKPDVRINLLVQRDRAVVAVDLSGDSLHRRGYRVHGSKAPLKESLAAAIVAKSGWLDGDDENSLIDPMCGSGTLLIEAAMMFGDSAPGLSRSYFGFMGWKQHDGELWDSLVDEALDREERGNEKTWPKIRGYDSDPQSIQAALKNIGRAGLDDRIHVERAEVANLVPCSSGGMLLSNLPFGERLAEAEVVTWLYRGLGRIAENRFGGWRLAVFISKPELTDSFGLSWQKRYRLYNGPLPCRLLVTTVEANRPTPFHWQIKDVSGVENGLDFINRLKKNLKNRLKWSGRAQVSCFRVYDRDLPDYNVSIDLYEKWVHVQEYAPPASIPAAVAAERFQLVLSCVRDVLGVRSDRLFIKTRSRQRGNSQYQKRSGRKKMYEVREGGCYLLVNFTDYLDTGLFLDHRPVRQKIFREAGGKRFLNLFGYTGTATVHAAAGGAASTTTVDLSKTYLQWARMNLALNGFDTIRNRMEPADCMSWLRQNQKRYDLIFIDPPTFSNTKKEKRVFDVQRDHEQLISLAMGHLEQDGLLIFSTNFRKFKLDKTVSERFAVKDITAESIPDDFSRNRKIHRCWEIRKKYE